MLCFLQLHKWEKEKDKAGFGSIESLTHVWKCKCGYWEMGDRKPGVKWATKMLYCQTAGILDEFWYFVVPVAAGIALVVLRFYLGR